ncbi:hypothetical protein JTB14_017588 [Gonioctena quinquepunctata]|nr:hypothetical protein JTB14_017588 [Gonioctena quinquepunctata]
MPAQVRKFPPGNDFLSKLRRIHPTMARSIMSDHHMQESQTPYQPMEQSRMYPSQNQRYTNYPSMQNNHPYPQGFMPSQPYPNYPTSCNYSRSPQMGPRFSSINSHERSISPRRGYPDNMGMPINYGVMPPQKVSPNYSQYAAPEYAQHYQHRRTPIGQEYYQQQCRQTQYLPHQMTSQEISEGRVTVSDSIKQYIENWADEETASEMNQMESSRLCKDGMRVRDDQSTETVFMINASELQYFENGIPLVTSENAIPMVASENGQYIIKSGVSIGNSSGMVRIVDNKTEHMDTGESNGERVVNLHIMDPFKQDCMLANKPNDSNQRQTNDNSYIPNKPTVLIHQNTVIQSCYQKQNTTRDMAFSDESEVTEEQVKVGNSLPIITDTLEDELNRSIKECRKITVDKNCSPITLDQLEEFKEESLQSSVICSNKNSEDEFSKDHDTNDNDNDSSMKNMPFIDENSDKINYKAENVQIKDMSETRASAAELAENFTKIELSEKILQIEFQKGTNGIRENQEESITPTEKLDSIQKEKMESVIYSGSEKSDSIENKISLTERKQLEVHENEDATTDISKPEVETNHPIETDTSPDLNQELNKNTEETKIVMAIENECQIKMETCNLNSLSKNKIEDTIKKMKNKRSKRIFSVDDIMNNIGKRSKSENDVLERRHSLQSTKEFLDREIANIFSITDIGDVESLSDNRPPEVAETQSCGDEQENEECLAINTEKKAIEKAEHLIEVPDIQYHKDLEKIEKDTLAVENSKKTNEQYESVDPEKIIDEGKMETNVFEKNYSQNPTELSEPQPQVTEDEKQMLEKEKQDSIDGIEPEKLLKDEIMESKNTVSTITDETTEMLNEKIIHERNETPSIISDSNKNENGMDKNENLIGKCVDFVENTKEVISSASPPQAHSQNKDLFITSIGQNIDILQEQETSSQASNEKKIYGGLDQNEIQYRSVIRVEESSVLLQIAGELVEVNVNSVNGKKVITVVPFSDTTVMDCNDNYETSPSPEVSDPLHMDNVITDPVHIENVITESNENFAEEIDYQVDEPEPDIVETTSEVIIGMDLSLEEEIKLDIAQTICTKAAMKAYDSDLQIPSITTSGDVYEKNEFVYSDNDKVSSSKQHRNKNKKTGRLIDSSRKVEHFKHSLSKTEKKSLSIEMARAKKKTKQQRNSEEEEFVPFRDLIRARKLKKLKQQEIRNIEDGKVDSTIKIDEINSENHESIDIPKNVNCLKNDKIKEKEYESMEEVINKKPSNEKNMELKRRNEGVPEFKAEIEIPNASSVDNTEDIIGCHSEKTLNVLKNGQVNDDIGKFVPACSKKEKYTEKVTNIKQKSGESLVCQKKETQKKAKNSKQVKMPKKNKNNVPEKIHFYRPKSLDDLNSLRPKENKFIKRKLSLQSSPVKQNYFDWEETQSPKTNFIHNNPDERFSEFSGLIHNNVGGKSNPPIQLNHSDTKSNPNIPGDEILQNYKDQVDFKLSSLKFEIPRIGKPIERPPINPFSKSESSSLMHRFLENEKLTSEEMEKIRKIIAYKRLIQQMKKNKIPETSHSKLNPTYEIHRDMGDCDTKLHLKKVSEKKRKNRFRNLYSQSSNESDNTSDNPKSDYSVVQSNCLAGVVPKLIIKRKTEMPLPVVRLERLDLGILANKRIRYVV